MNVEFHRSPHYREWNFPMSTPDLPVSRTSADGIKLQRPRPRFSATGKRDAAEQAVDYHDRKGPEGIDDFDSRNVVVDQRSLALVDRNEGYRMQALALAKSARKTQRTFDALRENYVNTYDLQVELLNAIAKHEGDLGRVFNLMQQKLPDKKRLEAECDKLRRDQQESLQQLQEQYAAFKDMTGITLDYVEPAASPHDTRSQ
jgi:hypothetical protein